MKRLAIAIFTLLLAIFGSAQQRLDGYRYIVVQTLTYQNGGIDSYGICASLTNYFQSMGISILSSDYKTWPADAKGDLCLVAFCSPFTSGQSTVGFTIRNCKNEVIYDEKSTSLNWTNDIQNNFNRALKNCLEKLDKRQYSFNGNLTPVLPLPEVEKTNETEASIKTYLTSNSVSVLEGIYKSYQTDDLSYYKLGIIKQGDTFKAIVIESVLKQWKPGEVKATFEPSAIANIYSVKWYRGNKTPVETFGRLDEEGLLTVELANPTTGAKEQQKFVKMFPTSAGPGVSTISGPKASGTGFFVTTGGVLATNAHVIEGASRIEATVQSDAGTATYKVKVILADKQNDIALLQIDDDKYKPIANLPYGIAENSDVGEKVFTIGYPLNDVMGTNYKVTDGIISSKTGISDDVRFYQISVPIQPGNSGGPLFNKDGNVIGLTTARLNGQAVGTSVQNVNYAIKSSYLLTLYGMLPNSSKLPPSSQLSNKELQDQVKVLKNFVCLIRIF